MLVSSLKIHMKRLAFLWNSKVTIQQDRNMGSFRRGLTHRLSPDHLGHGFGGMVLSAGRKETMATLLVKFLLSGYVRLQGSCACGP
jgi:hypothetical protein